MFLSVKSNKIIEGEYHFGRGIPVGLKVSVEKDRCVREDSILATGDIFEEKARIDVFSILNMKSADVREYIECIHGERLQKGDILIRRKKGILGKEKVIFSPCSGVVDLSEIDRGIIKILGVAKETIIHSGVRGKVLGIIKDKQVIIATKVLRMKPFGIWGDNIQGDLFYLGKKGVIERKVDLKGSIVVTDDNLDMEDYKQIALAGVKGIISGGIERDILDQIILERYFGMSICILEGYGNFRLSKQYATILERNDGHICQIDPSNKEIVLTNIEGIDDTFNKTQRLIKKVKVNDRVQAFDGDHWGMYGIVKSMDSEFVEINPEIQSLDKTVSIHKDNLVLCL